MAEANAINAATTGIVGNTGTAFTGTAVTQYNVIVGGSTSSTLSNIAPSATSGVPLISQGAASNPAFGTAVVAGGGTGATSFNTNGAVISGTSSTAALAAVSLASQQLLVGNSGAPTAKSISVNIQVFTSSGTYTPTSGMIYCIIECVGGGGGGGGTATSSAGNASCGGGGGGGGYSRKFASSATVGASQTVTIGAAGTAGTAGNNNGGNGGDTSVGTICIGKGANGGGGNPGNASAGGGAGGVAGTGDISVPGQYGFTGDFTLDTAVQRATSVGGASLLGYGGSAVVANAANTTGSTGQNYGGGGGGGLSYNNGGTQAGAAGAKGVVIITEFVIS